MKKIGWTLLLGIGCGTSGELGVAKFFVGDGWTHQSNIAVGSSFPFEAKQGFWNSNLRIVGCDEQIIKLEGTTAHALGSGICTLEAYGEGNNLVDRFTLNVKHAKEIQVLNPEDPNSYWSSEIPNNFAILEDSSAQFVVALTDENSEPLAQHSSLLLDKEESWALQSHISGEILSLYGHYPEKTNFSILHGLDIRKDFRVSVIDSRDIQSIMIRISPPVNRIPELNEEVDSSIYASHVYVSVDIQSADQLPVLLPEDSVRIVGQENYLNVGPQGFWVEKSRDESLEIEIKVGDRHAFTYVD
jgi:hypothetical protein